VIRIGFAGAGFIAGIHAALLTERRDARITAVFDAEARRAGELAASAGARTVHSFEALLGESDAVYLCVPNALHAELALQALAAGKHVFSEKPMATTLDDARRVAAAAAKAKGVYQIGFNKRFAPIYRALKDRIDAGELQPLWGHLKMNRGDLSQPPWVADDSLTGGFLYETPIHLLDASEWLFGPIDEIVCRAAQRCAGQLDDFALLLTFRSGLTATFCSSAHATWLYPFERVEVYGEHAAAVTEEMDRITFQTGPRGVPATQDVSALPVAERWGYTAEAESFLAAVRGKAPPGVDAAAGLRAIELVDACYRAAETGAPVRLD
jgi:myo-inositol 2-dehydrogenase/D-chiro-inositol 1-dehydrogenase